jgi:mRNA-degrading endonuclease RelE of RelBE toxin-antitoxin system
MVERMVFVETPIFTRRIGACMSDDEYGRLQAFLTENPAAGKVIRDSGGIRKLRWAGSGRGKRGGLRIIYFWWIARDRITMLIVYPKSERDDLSREQLKQLKRQIEA